MTSPPAETETEFERRYEQAILPFIKKRKHASCFELMKEFHLSYAESVKIMDTLEQQGIVGAAEPEVKGSRPLLDGKKRPTTPAPDVPWFDKRKGLAELAFEAGIKCGEARSRNYTADDEVMPESVTFANGRTVRIADNRAPGVNNGVFLEVEG